MFGVLHDFNIRFLQYLARNSFGGLSIRIWLHRRRGVKIGKGTFISMNAIIETAHPELVFIGENCFIGINAIIIAHNHNDGGSPNLPTVHIEDEAYIGPGAIILPGVTIGSGSVVAAGSVVTHSVPGGVMVQGNPAQPVAQCDASLGMQSSYWNFLKHLKPL